MHQANRKDTSKHAGTQPRQTKLIGTQRQTKGHEHADRQRDTIKQAKRNNNYFSTEASSAAPGGASSAAAAAPLRAPQQRLSGRIRFRPPAKRDVDASADPPQERDVDASAELLEALLSLGDWTGALPVALESLAAMVKGCEYPYFPAFKSAGMTEKESAAMVAAAAADGVHNPVVAIRMMMVGKLMWWICGEGGDGGSATERSRLLLGARTHLECARCVLRTTHGDDSTIYRDLLGLLDQVHAG